MIRIAIAASALAWLTSWLSAPPAPEHYELQVTTYDDQLYVAGAGSDCVAAWQGAHVPKGWREIRCVQVR
ncbi:MULTISPECIES: hypothetical protein [unclassified Mesorhizobium]|uniref:hypothetical protein n=1 Tax=unclassified Mesorhizobium TaxID=325217 RepID=UPI00112A65F8|nr:MULTISPECIES: hypothetical protein [unclassified Mesorhizobium]TPL42598.1 hypothetical protein FJ961_07870 [Mesorhizobium sp. B2-4-5]TPL66601.1 hypothetical protein FJ949_09550 [Mesorhizobium sp. B2-4-1]